MLLHSSAHPRIDYVGREEESESKEGLLKHYVGLYDPQTGELQVIEARKVVLRGTVREPDEGSEDKEKAEGEKGGSPLQTVRFCEVTGRSSTKTGIQARSLRNELSLAFGTKKARKAMASLIGNAVVTRKTGDDSFTKDSGPDAAGAALLDSMNVTTANTATREELQARSDEAKPRPKANLKAQKVEEVYPVETLVGTETMPQIMVKEWVDAAESKRVVTTKSRYVSQRLQKIATSGNVRKLKILRYLLLLLDFWSVLKPTGKGSKRLPEREVIRTTTGVSTFLIDGVVKRFADGSCVPANHNVK